MGLTLSGVSRAAGPVARKPAAKAAPKTHYMVSAILREGVQDFTCRLVHSVQSGSSVAAIQSYATAMGASTTAVAAAIVANDRGPGAHSKALKSGYRPQAVTAPF